MSKRELIFAAAGVVVGGAVGFAIGYKALKKKVEKNSQEKLDRQVQQLNDFEESLAEQYRWFTEEDEKDPAPAKKSAKERVKNHHDSAKNTFPSKDDVRKYNNVIDDVKCDDDITEEGFTVVTNSGKYRKPKVLGKEPKDLNDPDLEFDQEELYYYMSNELLVDENGDTINETDYIGNDLRRYGFMRGNGTLDYVWVRNYDHQVDYLVHRYASPDDSFMEEQDE